MGGTMSELTFLMDTQCFFFGSSHWKGEREGKSIEQSGKRIYVKVDRNDRNNS